MLATAGLLVADVATFTALRSFLLQRVDAQVQAAFPATIRVLSPGHRGPGDGDRDGDTVLPPGTYGAVATSDGTITDEVAFGADHIKSRPNIAGLNANGQPTTVSSLDGSFSYRTAAIVLDDNAILVVALPLYEVARTTNRLIGIELAVTLAVLAAIAAMSLWVIGTSLRPLEGIADTAGAIAEGDLSHRIEVAHPNTEVGRLSISLNLMLNQIEEAFAQRAASEERLRRFLADASHELRTPLTSIRGYAELFRRGASANLEDTAKAMQRIESESERMGVIVEELLLLARLDQGRPLIRESVNLSELATDAVADATAVEPDRPISVDARDAVMVSGDEVRLRQVTSNLVANAIKHTGVGTAVRVGVGIDGTNAVLTVADDGPGLQTADAERVFERFYRSDPARDRVTGGIGLGLSIVEAVVTAHDGEVSVETAPGKGATFTVRLPLLQGDQ